MLKYSSVGIRKHSVFFVILLVISRGYKVFRGRLILLASQQYTSFKVQRVTQKLYSYMQWSSIYPISTNLVRIPSVTY